MGFKAKEVRSMNGLLESCVKRAELDFDTMIICLGDEGKGKSTFAYKFAQALSERQGRGPFRAEFMVFASEGMVELAQEAEPGSIIVLDEAIDGAFSRDAMTGKNKDFVKFLTICRELNHTLIINAPRWGLLDGKVKERAHYAVLIEKRGLGKAHVVYTYDYKKKDPSLYDMFLFKFTKADDAEWWRYKQLKKDFVREKEGNASSGGGPSDLTKVPGYVPLVDIAGLSRR